MIEFLNKKSIEEFEAFNSTHKYGHFMQSAQWGEIKSDWSRRVLVARDESGVIKGGLSVLIRKVPILPFTLFYGNRGPVADPADVQTLKEIHDGLKSLAKREHAYMFMAEPALEDSEGDVCKSYQDAGFQFSKQTRGATAIQPSSVYRLTLTGKTQDEIMAGLHRKHRYALKQAIKFGVEIKHTGKEGLDEFMRIMRVTGDRQGISVRPRSYYEHVLDAMGEKVRLYFAYYNDTAIACAMNIWYGNKMWYLYAGSDNLHREVQPNYLLQWEMICWSLELGLDIYDFGGVAVGDVVLEGLNHFKKNFGGDLCEFIGTVEVVYKPFIKWIYELAMSAKYNLSHFLRSKHSNKNKNKQVTD